MQEFIYHFKSQRLLNQMKKGKGNKGVAITVVLSFHTVDHAVLAIAKCHRKDSYNSRKGVMIARNRGLTYSTGSRYPELARAISQTALNDGYQAVLNDESRLRRPDRKTVALLVLENFYLQSMHRGLLEKEIMRFNKISH